MFQLLKIKKFQEFLIIFHHFKTNNWLKSSQTDETQSKI